MTCETNCFTEGVSRHPNQLILRCLFRGEDCGTRNAPWSALAAPLPRLAAPESAGGSALLDPAAAAPHVLYAAIGAGVPVGTLSLLAVPCPTVDSGYPQVTRRPTPWLPAIPVNDQPTRPCWSWFEEIVFPQELVGAKRVSALLRVRSTHEWATPAPRSTAPYQSLVKSHGTVHLPWATRERAARTPARTLPRPRPRLAIM